MRVVFLGVRGSVCAPGPDFVRYGGNTSCLALSVAADSPPTLMLDAGTGIRTATDMLAGAPFRGTIAVSHVHWDHVQGLPFFVPVNRAGASLTICGRSDEGTLHDHLLAQVGVVDAQRVRALRHLLQQRPRPIADQRQRQIDAAAGERGGEFAF